MLNEIVFFKVNYKTRGHIFMWMFCFMVYIVYRLHFLISILVSQQTGNIGVFYMLFFPYVSAFLPTLPPPSQCFSDWNLIRLSHLNSRHCGWCQLNFYVFAWVPGKWTKSRRRQEDCVSCQTVQNQLEKHTRTSLSFLFTVSFSLIFQFIFIHFSNIHFSLFSVLLVFKYEMIKEFSCLPRGRCTCDLLRRRFFSLWFTASDSSSNKTKSSPAVSLWHQDKQSTVTSL